MQSAITTYLVDHIFKDGKILLDYTAISKWNIELWWKAFLKNWHMSLTLSPCNSLCKTVLTHSVKAVLLSWWTIKLFTWFFFLSISACLVNFFSSDDMKSSTRHRYHHHQDLSVQSPTDRWCWWNVILTTIACYVISSWSSCLVVIIIISCRLLVQKVDMLQYRLSIDIDLPPIF